jgi:hypothetical protein
LVLSLEERGDGADRYLVSLRCRVSIRWGLVLEGAATASLIRALVALPVFLLASLDVACSIRSLWAKFGINVVVQGESVSQLI